MQKLKEQATRKCSEAGKIRSDWLRVFWNQTQKFFDKNACMIEKGILGLFLIAENHIILRETTIS